ncbi:hypothetical protein BaRGS_00004023, partial [Batillaria attramentaria]
MRVVSSSSDGHFMVRRSSVLIRPPSNSVNYVQQDDTQSSRSGDTPVPPSQSNNSSQMAENNSESAHAGTQTYALEEFCWTVCVLSEHSLCCDFKSSRETTYNYKRPPFPTCPGVALIPRTYPRQNTGCGGAFEAQICPFNVLSAAEREATAQSVLRSVSLYRVHYWLKSSQYRREEMQRHTPACPIHGAREEAFDFTKDTHNTPFRPAPGGSCLGYPGNVTEPQFDSLLNPMYPDTVN